MERREFRPSWTSQRNASQEQRERQTWEPACLSSWSCAVWRPQSRSTFKQKKFTFLRSWHCLLPLTGQPNSTCRKMDIETRVIVATECSQLPPGSTERIKSCTWPGSDKFMKSSHPHENTVYFNLPSGNKSILNFCSRSLGLALFLRKDVRICLHRLFHPKIQCFLSRRGL